MPKYQSLSTKLSITTSIVATLMVIGIALYALVLKRNEVMVSDRRDVDLSMSHTALAINKVLAQVEASMNSNSWQIEKCLTAHDEESMDEVLTQLIHLNPEIISSGVIFDLDSTRTNKPFMLYASRDSVTKKTNLPAMVYDTRNLSYAWLRQPLLTGSSEWSSSHADLANGKTEVCTFLVPVDSDNIRVLFFADIPVSVINDIIIKDVPDFLIESFLIDRDGICLSVVNNPEYSRSVPTSLNYAEVQEALVALGDTIYEGKQGELDFMIDNKTHPAYYEVINPWGWTLFYVVDLSLFHSSLFKSTQVLILIFALSLIGLYLMLAFVIKRITQPLRLFSNSVLEISKGNLNAQLPEVTTNDEMAQLRDSFERMQQFLVKYTNELEESTRRQAFIKGELRIASNIQADLLPKRFPPFPERDDIDIYAALIPAKEIGGDLYNYFIRDDKLFFIIGDVSGKSVPAAIVMAMACTVFNTASSLSDDPTQIMNELNVTTCTNTEHSGFFITALVGVLDLRSGELQLCNAGHDPALIIHPDRQIEVLRIAPNLPAGIKPDFVYTSQTLQLETGSRILLYTDGITEAERGENEFYGLNRMIENMQRHAHQSLNDIIKATVDDVKEFSGHREQVDDLTAMVISYTPSERKVPALLTLNIEKSELLKVQKYCEEVSKALGFDVSKAYKFNLVMEEAVTNIINYAASKTKAKAITIFSSVHGDKLTVIISDPGKKFDPTAVPEADTAAPLSERQVGGLGITLLRRNTCKMEYRRMNRRNYLTLEFEC